MDEEQHLREKARLLLQRERELFELRLKHEQMGVWLEIGPALPALLSGTRSSLPDVCAGIRRLLITKLRLQRVVLLEVRAGSLEPLAPTGSGLQVSADARALLEQSPSGVCNDPETVAVPALAALAELLGLHRFVWSTVERAGDVPILLAAGFDRKKSVFQSPFELGDLAHFKNTAGQVQTLLGNALLIAELEREKNQLRQANLTLEQRDAALRLAAEQLRAANEGLEQRVQERTQELDLRNRDLRLVLDTVDQALLTVDLFGRLAPERSSVTDRWFGAYSGSPRFTEYVGAERRFAVIFELGLDGLRDGVLPAEICLDQLPKRLERQGKQFDCRYLPIEEGDRLKGLLLVIDDVTESLARAREEQEQRELLAAFSALMRDRNWFLTFCEETERILEALGRVGADPAQSKRLLHTLKGNAAGFGLLLVSDLCHRAESRFGQGEGFRQSVEQLNARWSEIRRTLGGVASGLLCSTIEVSESDLASLSTRARQGVSASELVEEIRRLRWESSARPLDRLAHHARALASRLGKGTIQVEIDADEARLEPARWAPVWSELVHVVRNAVDHGIEEPSEREAEGKHRTGKLRLATSRVGEGYRVEVEDDGRGIDWQAIRLRCVERGCPHETRADLLRALLSPGFSTRAQVTDTSGRGMGLAALANAVSELGGCVDVSSELGHGARWVLTFPSLEAPPVPPK